MRAWFLWLFVFGLGIGIALLGVNTLSAKTESFIIWEVDEVRVPVNHYEIILVPNPIYYPEYVEVEKIISIPKELRNFETTAELRRWLDKAPRIYPFGDKVDCDDFALALIEQATKDGYYLYFFPDLYHRHFKCVAIAGNNVYLVEPQGYEMELYMRVD